jgi:6-phosphofructokinase 2
LSEGRALETAFQAGMAAGAAALLAPGTSLCQAVDVFDLMKVAGCEPV